MSVYLREDLTRNEKIQQARRMINENKFALDAWAILIQDAQEKKIAESREFFESLLTQFPTCGKFWKIYIEAEMKGRNYDRVEKLFQQCLIKVLNIDLWKCYLTYVRDTKNILPTFREKMAQAYDFALEKIGMDVHAFSIWNDYITFLKSVEAIGAYAENQKIAAVRKVYQRAILTPMINVELLWKDYCTFEMNVNSILGKNIIENRSRDFLNVKRVAKEFESLTRTIDRHLPCLPLTNPPTSDEMKQFSAWRKYLQWERSNPLKSEDFHQIHRRVLFAYEQCLLCMGYHVDLWYEACAYLEETSRIYAERADANMSKRFLDEAATFYERAIKTYMRSNMLIHFAYADLEESRLHIDKARSIYHRLLDVHEGELKDATLAYIQAMRFERRADGIKAARTLFKRAREDPRTNHQIYVAAALMEYYCTKDNNIAFNIFNLGLKKYSQNIDYILAYVDFMTHLNEDHNARVLFERVLANDSTLDKQFQGPIWYEFLRFESQVGDLLSIKKVEHRRLNLLAELNEIEGRETFLLIDRYKFLNLFPCSNDELKYLGYRDNSSTNVPIIGQQIFEETSRDRRTHCPRPDPTHMMPYRPTRNPLPGSHPTAGGVFPLPDTALYLVKVLPPARNFEGPFVIVDALMDFVQRTTIPDDFEPIRMNVQGEMIRDLETTNSNNRKSERPDSDDEDPSHRTTNGCGAGTTTTNIYIERLKKRVKLTNPSDFI